MRRIVDAVIPLFLVIATVPVFSQIFDIPVSLERSLGEGFGIVWCVVVGAASAAVWVGVTIRRRWPSVSFRFEFPGLIVAGTISAIFGVTILSLAPLRGWTAAWFVFAIGGWYVCRFIELAAARRAVKQATVEAAR